MIKQENKILPEHKLIQYKYILAQIKHIWMHKKNMITNIVHKSYNPTVLSHALLSVSSSLVHSSPS